MEDLSGHIRDILRYFGEVSFRRMFSGYGVFHQGLMFALVCDESLYLKTDDTIVGDFNELNLEQFKYTRQGKNVGLSYYRAPDIVLEEPDEAARWARRSYEAAIRSSSKHRRHSTSVCASGSPSQAERPNSPVKNFLC